MTDTWNPTNPIAVFGAGMWATGPWVSNVPAAIQNRLGSGTRLLHGDGDWVELGGGHAAASRTLSTSLGSSADVSYWTPGNGWNGLPQVQCVSSMAALIYGLPATWSVWAAGNPSTGGVLTVPTTPNGFYYSVSNTGSGTFGAFEPTFPTVIGATTLPDANGVIFTCAGQTFAGGARLVAAMRVHHGATLASVQFSITIGSAQHPSQGLPVAQPRFRVFSLSKAGVVTPLQSNPATTGWVGNGYLELQAINATTYYNGGTQYGFTYTCDAGVVIDITENAYFVEVIDEAGFGAMAGNIYDLATASFTSIPDLRPQ